MSGPADRADGERASDAEPLVEHRIIRRRERVFAEGSLVCPGCEMPILPPGGAVAITGELECGFCGVAEPASRFVRVAGRDVPGNRIRLTAALPGR